MTFSCIFFIFIEIDDLIIKWILIFAWIVFYHLRKWWLNTLFTRNNLTFRFIQYVWDSNFSFFKKASHKNQLFLWSNSSEKNACFKGLNYNLKLNSYSEWTFDPKNSTYVNANRSYSMFEYWNSLLVKLVILNLCWLILCPMGEIFSIYFCRNNVVHMRTKESVSFELQKSDLFYF